MKKKHQRLMASLLSAAMAVSSVPMSMVPVQAADSIVIEAENYNSKSGTINILKANQASGGKYLGDFGTNDCVSYNVDVPTAGNYQVLVRVGTQNSGGIVHANCNGSFSAEASVPNTGAWQTYQEVEMKVWMEAGPQILTVSNLAATWNLDKITLTYLDSIVEEKNLEPYNSIYLENRWKNQRQR